MNKQRFIGLLVYLLASILHWTLRFRIERHPDYSIHQQYLFAFWHGKQFLPVLKFHLHQTPRATLVSPSKDGEILSTWLEKLNIETIRGSSRRNNVSALVGMIRKLKEGFSLGFGIDGPLGPIYQVKPGMTHMAQKLGIAIVPVGTAFSRKWIFEKAWDKFQLPKFFSKATCFVGAPIFVAPDADLELCNRLLEEQLKLVEARAEAMLAEV